MKLLIALLFFTNSFEVFGYRWTVPNTADWKLEKGKGSPVLHLLIGREPPPGPRRPMQFALAETPMFHNVTIDADLKPLKRSLIIVFAYHDAAHFDYAHLSTDTATKEPNHNGIFHVYGGERVRISSEAGPPAFAAASRWYHIRLTFDGASGQVRVSVNGQRLSALEASDMSLSSGRVGIGSFDETGDFRAVHIAGH